MPEERDAVRACARAIDGKRGEGVVVLDVRGLTFLDYLIVATAQGERHLSALSREVETVLKRRRLPVRSVEGSPKSGWMLVDAFDFVAHLMTARTRAYYDLEMLWGDAPRVIWNDRQDAQTG